jgi:hypothetical protein
MATLNLYSSLIMAHEKLVTRYLLYEIIMNLDTGEYPV